MTLVVRRQYIFSHQPEASLATELEVQGRRRSFGSAVAYPEIDVCIFPSVCLFACFYFLSRSKVFPPSYVRDCIPIVACIGGRLGMCMGRHIGVLYHLFRFARDVLSPL